MSTEISLLSVGIVLIACAALLVLDRISRAQVATPHRERRRGAPPSPDDRQPRPAQGWQVKVEPDRRPWWRRVGSGAGLTLLVLLLAALLAAGVGALAAAIYLGLESATK